MKPSASTERSGWRPADRTALRKNGEFVSSVSIDELVARAREGRARAVAILLSLVENAHPRLPELAQALTPYTGNSRIIGLTGPPGVGKSTLTSLLVGALRSQGKRVGVLAIDPSSPFTGGALLGDRIRMIEHVTDPGVFIRSMATRGHLGGLSWSTPQAVRVLDVCFDVVLVETVGVGQSEIDVVRLADTTVVLLAPGLGDAVQAAKAGVLEIADCFVVNKSERDGADAVVHDLKQMIAFGRNGLPGPLWRQPVVRTSAVRRDGAEELLAALDSHYDWLTTRGLLIPRRIERAEREIEAITMRNLQTEISHLDGGEHIARLAREIVDRLKDPYAAAQELIAAISA